MTAFVPDPSWPTILDLAIMLWGKPTYWTHNRDEARFGAKQSKSIRLSTRVWRDHETGEDGGYVDLHLKAIGPLPKPAPKHKAGNGKANGNLPPWENVDRRTATPTRPAR